MAKAGWAFHVTQLRPRAAIQISARESEISNDRGKLGHALVYPMQSERGVVLGSCPPNRRKSPVLS